MKRIIIIILAFLFYCVSTVSCIQELTGPADGEVITIEASRESLGNDTKTLISGTKVLWDQNEEISVFYGSGSDGGSRFISTMDEPGEIAAFTGTIQSITGSLGDQENDDWYWAVYPYRTDITCDGNSITTFVPASQTAKKGSFADGVFLSIGRAKGPRIPFYNVCGGICFTVDKPGITTVKITGNGGETLAGKVSVGFNNENRPVVQEILSSSADITVVAPANECFVVGEPYYAVMIPTVLENGFTVSFEGGIISGTRNIESRVEIERSMFSRMTDADKDVSYIVDASKAQGLMDQAYSLYRTTSTSGLVANLDNIGSDVERCSVGLIARLVGGAQLYAAPYTRDQVSINDNTWRSAFSNMSQMVFICNGLIAGLETYCEEEGLFESAPGPWTDLLGQAYALRATMYYDFVRYFGDVPYTTASEPNATSLASRDFIMESELACLERVESWLYPVGAGGKQSTAMSRNYVDGLIGRICLMEAGYQTRRTDLGNDFYTGLDGTPLSFDVWGTDTDAQAQYARRTDWSVFCERALPYLRKAVNEPGSVSLTTADPRSDALGRTYGNPFQYYFSLVNDQQLAAESVFEIEMGPRDGSRIAYNFGRGSNGGTPALPPKANAQTCSFPLVYYGMFDPQDMRRDVSLSVTGSSGLGREVLYSFNLSNRNTGGIGMNKYDLNRQTNPDLRQLYSGINFVQMRQADVLLMLAEVLARLGNEAEAAGYLRQIHDRAFPAAVRDVKYSALLNSVGGNLVDAILEERKLEFVGEGLRRWDLVRSGKLPEVAFNQRKQLVDGIAEMKSQGYTQFDNGNQFPAYVWTKQVNARDILGYRLTMQTPAGLDDTTLEGALLVPGWRGQHDDWQQAKDAFIQSAGFDVAAVPEETYTNTAIKGLFRYIAPGSDEALALEADGWVKTVWGIGQFQTNASVNSAQEAKWGSEFMAGYSDADYAARKAPVYLLPYSSFVCASLGVSNGYGFKSNLEI